MKKKFFRARAIHSRLPSAPEQLTLPEVSFYTGASAIAVKKWTLEWKSGNLVGPDKLANQMAGPGSNWIVRKALLIPWLIARKHVRLDPALNYPDHTEATMLIDNVAAGALSAAGKPRKGGTPGLA
jgi:hypothetical protein